MGATCSQPREHANLDVYAKERIWSSYTLENREEIDEEYASKGLYSKKLWPGVFGFDHEVIALEKGCFTSPEDFEDDGFVSPGSGIGSSALGYDENGEPIHGLSKTNRYAEVHTNISGPRVRRKSAHDLIWFDNRYDLNNQRKTVVVSKHVRRGDETDSEDDDAEAADEDGEGATEDATVAAVAGENEDEDDEDGLAGLEPSMSVDPASQPLAEAEAEPGVPEEPEVTSDSDEDPAAGAEPDSEGDIDELLKAESECRLDSPRSRYQVLTATLEGMDEARAEAYVRGLKRAEMAKERRKRQVMGATLGLTPEEIEEADLRRRRELLQAARDHRRAERAAKLQELLDAQRKRREERAWRRADRLARQAAAEAERLRALEAEELERKRAAIGVSSLEAGFGGPGGRVIEELDFSDYVLGQPLLGLRQLDTGAEVEAQLQAALLDVDDIAGRQQAILRKQQLQRDRAMKAKLARRRRQAGAGEGDAAIEQQRLAVEAERAEAERAARIQQLQQDGEQADVAESQPLTQRQSGSAAASPAGKKPEATAVKQADAASPTPTTSPASAPATVRQVAAKGESNSALTPAAVVEGVKLIALEEIRWWEAQLLRPIDRDQWRSFAEEAGKFSFFKADAGALQGTSGGNKDLKVFLGQLFIPGVSPVEVFHQLYDVPTRGLWDNCYMCNEVSRGFPEQPFHNELWFTRVSLPVMKARDFLLLRGYVLYRSAAAMITSHQQAEHTGAQAGAAAAVDPTQDYQAFLEPGRQEELDAITYVYRSAEHSCVPEDKDTLRAFSQGANLFYSVPQPESASVGGVTITLPEDRVSQGRKGTLMYLVSSNDPKASVPAWMINSAAVSSFKDWCKLVLKHMGTLAKKDI